MLGLLFLTVFPQILFLSLAGLPESDPGLPALGHRGRGWARPCPIAREQSSGPDIVHETQRRQGSSTPVPAGCWALFWLMSSGQQELGEDFLEDALPFFSIPLRPARRMGEASLLEPRAQ